MPYVTNFDFEPAVMDMLGPGWTHNIQIKPNNLYISEFIIFQWSVGGLLEEARTYFYVIQHIHKVSPA